MNLTCEVSLIMTTHVKDVTIATNTISLKSYILQYNSNNNIIRQDIWCNYYITLAVYRMYKIVLSMIYPYNGHAIA